MVSVRIDPCKKIERQKITKPTWQVNFKEAAKTIKFIKKETFQHIMLEQLDFQVEKNASHLENKTAKFREENIGGILCDVSAGAFFFFMWGKMKSTNFIDKKVDKLYFIKIRYFCFLKNIFKYMKGTTVKWEKLSRYINTENS